MRVNQNIGILVVQNKPSPMNHVNIHIKAIFYKVQGNTYFQHLLYCITPVSQGSTGRLVSKFRETFQRAETWAKTIIYRKYHLKHPTVKWMFRSSTCLRPQFQETTGKTSQDHLWFCLVLKHTSFLFEPFQFTGIVKLHLIQLTKGYCWIHLALPGIWSSFSFFFHPTSHGFLAISEFKLGNLLIQDWTYTCYASSWRERY